MTISRWVAAVLTLVAVSARPCLAAKVTSDPNAGAKPPESAKTDTDQRLAQPVTYEGGYKRLHYALEELSAQTGVSIRCGTSSKDWPVRDLPVVISAHDIPLGKLLQAIASSTDLDLISETLKTDAGKEEKAYRLLLNRRSQTAVGNDLAIKRQAAIDRQSQQWDALVANVDVPDSDVQTKDNHGVQTTRAVARILKDLGPDAKAKVLAGQRIDLTTQNYHNPELLRTWYRADWDQFKSDNTTGQPLTNQQIDAATFSIIPEANETTGAFDVKISVPIRYGSTTVTRFMTLTTAARDLWQYTSWHKAPEIVGSKPPKVGPPPDHITKDLVPLDLKPDAKQPPAFLSQKVKLDLPKDRDVSYAEVFAFLAKRTGLTIVAEDYKDHKSKRMLSPPKEDHVLYLSWGPTDESKLPPYSPVSALPEDTTVGDILRAVSGPSQWDQRFEWFYNEDAKLLVGRAPNWLAEHQNLMPESLLVHLRDRANGSGIELDDLTKLTSYTTGQRNEWVCQNKDLSFIGYVRRDNSPTDIFWRFYDTLPPEEKDAAKSEGGLALAKYEQAWVAAFSGIGPDPDNVVTQVFATEKERLQHEQEARKQAALLVNPEAVRGMMLKLTRKSVPVFVFSPAGAYTSTTREGYTYSAAAQDSNGEIKFDPFYHRFPIYSPKRESELDAAGKQARPK